VTVPNFDDALLGLPGFWVLAVTDDGNELLVGIETIRRAAGCPSCRVIARTKERLRVLIRDLPAFDRRVRLVGSKRRFCCPDPDCRVQTWTERSDELSDRRVLSSRAGRECTRAVGSGRSVASPLSSSSSPSPVSSPWQHDQSQPESTERAAGARQLSDRS
jgi:transposase